jgi:FAD/FMN-containing dehydrogenase
MHQARDHAPLLEQLAELVDARGILTGADQLAYEIGARYGKGSALCVLRPNCVDDVSRIVQFCADQKLRIVVQGGNTGLVGASSPDTSGEQVLLSLSRLRNHCVADVANRCVTVDAGVTLQELNDLLEPLGYWFPVDLGANPTIGGMIAANTGGTRLIRYGDVRHNLLSVESVLLEPAGCILQLGRALRKDNTGFDLKQLFVGTSGVAGIITRATLEIHPRPKQSATALVTPVNDTAVIPLLLALEDELGDFLSAFEGMSAAAMQAAIAHIPSLRNPFAPDDIPDFAVLIELESSSSPTHSGLDLQEVLNRFLEDKFETLISNAVIGNGNDLWHVRHGISEGARHLGKTIAFDVSVPRARIMEFRQRAADLVQRQFSHLKVIDFGHIADGGVHFNLVWPSDSEHSYDPKSVQRVRDQIYALVVDHFGGSFSAEHGVGPHNQHYYERYTPAAAKNLAGSIQHMLNPTALCGMVNFGPSAAN